jgi:hypothetical protein
MQCANRLVLVNQRDTQLGVEFHTWRFYPSAGRCALIVLCISRHHGMTGQCFAVEGTRLDLLWRTVQ